MRVSVLTGFPTTRREFRKLGLGGGGNEIQVAVLMKHSLECLMIYLIASCQTCHNREAWASTVKTRTIH